MIFSLIQVKIIISKQQKMIKICQPHKKPDNMDIQILSQTNLDNQKHLETTEKAIKTPAINAFFKKGKGKKRTIK
jgi:hypothetical protein